MVVSDAQWLPGVAGLWYFLDIYAPFGAFILGPTGEL